ncbi:MAG: L-aspartate oxidase [Acidithiobacillus sp.]
MPSYDFLIIGSGAAGLSAALGLSRLGSVAILSKDQAAVSASDWAQGGMAAVTDFDNDSLELHIEDTLNAGAGLCHSDAVRHIIRSGPQAARQLIDWGVPFDRQENGALHLTREGGHRARRVLHRADTTGNAIESTLLGQIHTHARIALFENHFVSDLWLHNDRCHGAWVLTPHHAQPELWRARAVILASGGAGQLYPSTSNPLIATGDGIAHAWRAGAEIANLEFIQFHPTTFYDPGSAPFLLSEALRGEGAVLRLPDGRSFLADYDDRAELAPRDIVARAIDTEMKKHQLQYVNLDISGQPEALIRHHFPAIYAHCKAHGYELTREPIPVVPAAHYTCGGVVVDSAGRTNIPGLYAAGEVSSTGLHGANRLASNSLLECVVGAAAIVADLEGAPHLPKLTNTTSEPTSSGAAPTLPIATLRQKLQAEMWQSAGIVRNDHDLQGATDRLREMVRKVGDHIAGSPAYQELRNLRLCAEILTHSALLRRESRGCHYNRDHAERHEPPRDLISQRGQAEPRARPIPAQLAVATAANPRA